ncbi:hypothetical protein FGSG_11546 [Fusarium graminearum PH-1]|uniref:Chromosome 2, complete genome n=1 Tax=Gibberella zeae (strain ATCC MYA-4620 / CBS 123657 / FGSC 9075 / NRRL 31084 / PH-1) TaxID=229533 RepID=I1S3Z4_GIBZE|nr:hypothetical protein FGSG_11546 [Fusarium graminearum PH-1]ESU08316.1 hypothetical protein FGSG_11546 [Fusarium graminearum PH-1]CEF79789.1 unnamed protein product [Fusarium graminearum]|eukprot:XP_011323080.1 hypothetical protein FGSG_11546 [Fusarium graminearum PH-1]
MRFYTASLFLPLLPGVTAWAFPSHSLNRREAFELTEREDSSGDKVWIVPANVTVEDWDTAEPGEGWIPIDEYMRRMGIAPLEDTSGLEEPDIETLPLPEAKRGSLEERAARTRVNIGRKLTDYGCAASIRKPIEESLNMLCSNGFCDQSISYVRTIDWLDNGFGSGMSRRKLIVDIKGNYRGSRTKGNVIEAAKRIVNPDSVSHAKRSMKVDSTTCLRYGICKIVTCDMSKFANFISITKFEDPATYISIDMHIKMNESNNHCIARGVLSAIGGAISGIAGGFFGIADAFTPGC